MAPDRYAGLQMDLPSTGTLVYFRGSVVHERQPVWVDKKGANLLLTRFDAGEHWTGSAWNRDMLISRDGSRFLMLKIKDDPPDYRRIHVVLNWFHELRSTAGK